MRKYQLLEHKADLKIKVFGRNLEELFINAALAMAEQQNPTVKKSAQVWEAMEIKSTGLNYLLVDWLNELLFRSDLNQKIYTNFQIERLSKNRLTAKIAGQKINQRRLEIKAATYHQLEVKQENGQWEAVIIFDI